MNRERKFFQRLTLFALCAALLTPQEAIQGSSATEQTAQAGVWEPFDRGWSVQLQTDEGPLELTLEDYLVGVLFGEMPVSFSPEALKAQAVAARTFTLKTCAGSSHDGAICADSGCCQAWLSEDALRSRYGADYEAALAKVRRAIRETDGVILLYGSTLIDAVYFSCSGGRTETAAAVWGTEVPYLQTVESPGEEFAAHDTDEVTFTLTEFAEKISEQLPSADLSGAPGGWLQAVSYTDGGGVAELEIGGVNCTGTELRRWLGLRSTAFEVVVETDTITFQTRGFGHRVGMSQYGAEAMARSGATYAEILTHYYSNVTLLSLGE